jgi:hypothetical protein
VKWPVLVRRKAVIDLREARLWYESQRPGLGDELEQIARRAIQVLEDDPDVIPSIIVIFVA